MRRKAGHLRSVPKATDICLLQETHGSMQELGRIFNCLQGEWSWFFNPGASRSAGGTAVLIRKRAAPGAAGCTTEVIILGRVSRTLWSKDNKANVIWNLHNLASARRRSRTSTAASTPTVAQPKQTRTTMRCGSQGISNFHRKSPRSSLFVFPRLRDGITAGDSRRRKAHGLRSASSRSSRSALQHISAGRLTSSLASTGFSQRRRVGAFFA